MVLSIDEKSQIQALDRTQPGLVPGLDPGITPGRCQSMKHDYKRRGTTTLFATLSVWSSRSCGGAERERLSAVYAVRSVILLGVTTTHLPGTVNDN